jgi:hypothetical protein
MGGAGVVPDLTGFLSLRQPEAIRAVLLQKRMLDRFVRRREDLPDTVLVMIVIHPTDCWPEQDQPA